MAFRLVAVVASAREEGEKEAATDGHLVKVGFRDIGDAHVMMTTSNLLALIHTGGRRRW